MREVYSDKQRAAALAALRAAGWRDGEPLTSEQIRKAKTGIPRSTLMGWTSGEVVAVTLTDVRQEEQEAVMALDGLCEQVAHGCLGYVATWLEKFGDMPDGRMLRDVMVAFGIAVDKMRLLREQPTARLAIEDLRQATAEAGMAPEDVIAEVEAMLREGAE
jgi:hypothetical protein